MSEMNEKKKKPERIIASVAEGEDLQEIAVDMYRALTGKEPTESELLELKLVLSEND